MTWSTYCKHDLYFCLSLASLTSQSLLPCVLQHYHAQIHSSYLCQFLSVSEVPSLTLYSELSSAGLHGVMCLNLCSKEMHILDRPTQLCVLVTAQWWPVGVEATLLSASWAMHPHGSLCTSITGGTYAPLSHRSMCWPSLCEDAAARNQPRSTDSPPSFWLASGCLPLSPYDCRTRQKARKQASSLPLACHILSDRVQPPPRFQATSVDCADLIISFFIWACLLRAPCSQILHYCMRSLAVRLRCGPATVWKLSTASHCPLGEESCHTLAFPHLYVPATANPVHLPSSCCLALCLGYNLGQMPLSWAPP